MSRCGDGWGGEESAAQAAREENGASRIAHRRPGSARRDATHAPLGRCTWLSASMSRRDLNFPTLGALSYPFPSSVHCIAFTRCGATTSLSALLFSLPTLPASTSCVRVRVRVRLPAPSRAAVARAHAHAYTYTYMQTWQTGTRVRVVSVCVYVTRSL